MKRLPPLEAGDVRLRLRLAGVRDVDMNTDRHPRLGRGWLPDVDDRRAVAGIGDAREWDVAEKPRRLRGYGKPFPGGGIVDVRRAVGLALAQQRIVQPSQMNAPRAADGVVEHFGEPARVAMSGRRIDAVRIDLFCEHGCGSQRQAGREQTLAQRSRGRRVEGAGHAAASPGAAPNSSSSMTRLWLPWTAQPARGVRQNSSILRRPGYAASIIS